MSPASGIAREKLGSEFRKTFRVSQADVRQPDPKRWKLAVPDVGSSEPLVVSFDELLDDAMLQHVINVSNPSGALVDGRVSVDENETRWSFLPVKPWIAGTHRLLVEATLEDLAGNSIARPFEVHLPTSRHADVAETMIPFRITELTAESRSQSKSR